MQGLRKIIRLGHPTLRERALPFAQEEITSEESKNLVKQMCSQLGVGVGLAAPQVGVSKRLIIVRCKGLEMPRLSEFDTKVLFNPNIECLLKHEQVKVWESCLSVPGLYGKVTRYNNVLVHYFDEEGRKKRLAATGLIAAIFQHECDHLDGVIYLDRMQGMKDLCFEEELMDFRVDNDTLEEGTIKFFDK
jgi:peptide deformylase